MIYRFTEGYHRSHTLFLSTCVTRLRVDLIALALGIGDIVKQHLFNIRAFYVK